MAENDYKIQRKEVARFMRRLYNHRLTTTSGGNISLRVSDDIILITPSATDKGTMRWKEIGIMTMNGENLTPGLKPSIEFEMHLSVYRKMKDVKAIVHAHPVFASSFTATKCEIDTTLTAEAVAILGTPVMVPYALMGTSGLAGIVAENAEKSTVLLLENHGVLTTGNTILQAFDRIEVLENAAKMTVIVGLTKGKRPLSESRLKEIENMFGC
jgi:L-fuculose-phosphate aldolase